MYKLTSNNLNNLNKYSLTILRDGNQLKVGDVINSGDSLIVMSLTQAADSYRIYTQDGDVKSGVRWYAVGSGDQYLNINVDPDGFQAEITFADPKAPYGSWQGLIVDARKLTRKILKTVGTATLENLNGINIIKAQNELRGTEVLKPNDLILEGDVFTATAPDGKVFNNTDPKGGTSSVYMVYSTVSPNKIAPFTLSTDRKTATLKLADYPDLKTITNFNASVIDEEVKTPVHTFNQSDIDSISSSNLTGLINGVAIKTGDSVYVGDVIKFAANSGYMINSVHYMDEYGSNTADFTVATDQLSASHTVSDGDKFETLYSDVVKIPTPKVEFYTLEDSDLATIKSAGIDFKVGDIEAFSSQVINVGDVITATVIGDRKFINDPDNDNKPSIYFTIWSEYGDSPENTVYFTLSDDLKTATLTVPEVPKDPSEYTSYRVNNLVAKTEQESIVTVGSNASYIVTNDDIDKINKNRIVYKSTDVDSVTPFDYGQFILGLIKLPFTIPSEYIGEAEGVKLADLDTKVTAPLLKNNEINIYLGKFDIKSKYGNFLDYDNTLAIIHLPRIQPFNVDLEYILDFELEVNLIVDVYSGSASINLKSSKTGEVVLNKTVDLGVNVPYSNTGINGFGASNTNIELGSNNEVKTPFIEIVRNDSPLKDSVFSAPVVDENTLGSFTGYVVVNDVKLITDAMTSDKTDIISKLKQGVFL